jgi:AcrR family transcriptional regulator
MTHVTGRGGPGPEAQPHGGRGARERIMWAARKLFYEQGVNATGMDELTKVAHVSKRTFYQHFPSKEALVSAYLAEYHRETGTPLERALDREGLTPRERLLAIFEARGDRPVHRGCPFHNVAVELSDAASPARVLVADHKHAFARRLTTLAAEAGAADPESLGRQLAVLFEGATALSTSLNSPAPYAAAHTAAATLIDAATA